MTLQYSLPYNFSACSRILIALNSLVSRIVVLIAILDVTEMTTVGTIPTRKTVLVCIGLCFSFTEDIYLARVFSAKTYTYYNIFASLST